MLCSAEPCYLVLYYCHHISASCLDSDKEPCATVIIVIKTPLRSHLPMNRPTIQ